MKKILTFAAMGVGAAAAAVTSGCASQKAVANAMTKPAAGHIVQIELNAKKDGVSYNSLTGGAGLGIEGASVSIITVPVTLYSDTNGDLHYVSPDVVVSGELGSKYAIFGAYAVTHTFGCGRLGSQTQLGGDHQPINEGFYGTNNLMAYGQLQTGSGATPFTTTTTQQVVGTNIVQTITSQKTIPLTVPGF